MMDKKGVLGIETAKLVIVGLLVLGVLVVAAYLALSTLRDTAETSDTKLTGSVTNESLTSVNELGEFLAATSLRNPTCTVTQCVNATEGLVIQTANYTATGCKVRYSYAGASPINNTNWKCTYTYTYNDPASYNIVGNITLGGQNFFKQIPTAFTLLGVVSIIMVIAIVIAAVSGFGGVGLGRGERERGGGDMDEL